MSTTHQYKKISELSHDQKCHLAWRIDHKTAIGILTACRIARGQMGDMTTKEVFDKCEIPEHKAAFNARRVEKYDEKRFTAAAEKRELKLKEIEKLT